MRKKTWVFGLLTLGLLVLTGYLYADAGANAGQVQQIVNSNNQSWWGKAVNAISGNVVYGLFCWAEMALYVIWLGVTWAVVKLYSGIGNFLIPIWDFTNSTGFLGWSHTGNDTQALSEVLVPANAAALLHSMTPWVGSVCGILVVGLTTLSIPKNTLRGDGSDPMSVLAGPMWAVGLLVVYPMLYSLPIHIGNILGREFYLLSQQQYATQAQQQGSPAGLFDSLYSNSIFTPAAKGGALQNFAAAVAGASAGPQGLGAAAGLMGSNTVGMSATGLTGTAAIEQNFNYLTQSVDPQSSTNLAQVWANVKGQMMVSMEVQASRFIQICLGIMAIIGLVGLLMLKGAQIVSLVLNYYLGFFACALFAHPSTRASFGAWVKAHITLCLWGLIWAMLIFIMDVIVLASKGLSGMTQDPSLKAGHFLPIGLFMMPFILFAAIHMFKDVKSLANSLAATSDLAHNIGGGVMATFREGNSGTLAKGIQNGQGAALEKVGGGVEMAGVAWQGGMQAIANKASVAAAGTGVGAAVAGAIQVGATAAGQLGSQTAKVAGGGMRHIGHSIRPARQMADNQKAPPAAPTPPPPTTTEIVNAAAAERHNPFRGVM